MHRPEDLLDAHPIVEDAVEHGVGDFVVVQGTGFHARGCDAEGCATVAPGPVIAIGDVETDDLLVGDGTDLTVKDILRLPSLPQVGHGAWLVAHFKGMVRTWEYFISMACLFGGLGWGTISPSTQILTFAVKSSCGTT